MSAKLHRLAIKLDDRDLAGLLVNAGFDNPAKIREATDEQLEAVPGIGKATRGRLRKKFAKRG